MRSGLHDLVDALARAEPGTIVFQVATYPRGRNDGSKLEEQGEVIAGLAGRVLSRDPAAKAYRVLWTHLVFVGPPETSNEVKRAVLDVASTMVHAEVEVRGAWRILDGPVSERWLDEFFGELSTRRNFGTVESVQGRMVDGSEVITLSG